jgi:hypothetical protein
MHEVSVDEEPVPRRTYPLPPTPGIALTPSPPRSVPDTKTTGVAVQLRVEGNPVPLADEADMMSIVIADD